MFNRNDGSPSNDSTIQSNNWCLIAWGESCLDGARGCCSWMLSLASGELLELGESFERGYLLVID